MATAIITVASAKAWLGITDSSQDAVLTTIVAAVNEAIETFCDVSFTDNTVTNEIHDARRQDLIVPEFWPIISVQRVAVGVNPDGSGGTDLVAGTDYVLRDGEIALVGRSLPQGRGLVAVDYHHGYAAVPAKVTMAGQLATEAYYRMKSNKTVGIVSKSKEGESINYQKGWSQQWGLPSESIGLLQEYKLVGIPSGTSMATRNR